mgnify:CR=1 FL=1
MKICILDGYTANPGDLSWKALEDMGEISVYERTPREQLLSRAGRADALIVNKVGLDAETISELPELKYIGIAATGYDLIDLEAAKARGIAVTNVPDYSSPSVAQGVFALLLELTNHAAHHSEGVKSGKWSANPDFCYWDYPVTELSGHSMGIFGYGNTGRRTARIASAMGMDVVVCTRTVPRENPDAVVFCTQQELIENSDVISLHCPLTEYTKKMVDEHWLRAMKDSALLINTSRGPVVDEQALARALREGWIAGAGLDVMDREPPQADNPLFTAPNCFITPHICWASREARTRLINEIAENLRAFMSGKTRNRLV